MTIDTYNVASSSPTSLYQCCRLSNRFIRTYININLLFKVSFISTNSMLLMLLYITLNLSWRKYFKVQLNKQDYVILLKNVAKNNKY